MYATILIADWLLSGLFWWLMGDTIAGYPLLGTAADIVKIGIGILAMIGGVIHSAISFYGQVRLDIELAKEPIP